MDHFGKFGSHGTLIKISATNFLGHPEQILGANRSNDSPIHEFMKPVGLKSKLVLPVVHNKDSSDSKPIVWSTSDFLWKLNFFSHTSLSS